MSKPYPALVRHPGNASLFDAIEVSIVATLMGRPLHLHAEGLRGTGKTTILRAARQVLPPIRRIRGCLYNCDPRRPHCPEHAGLDPERLGALGDEWVPMPFLELSHASKLGTAVGSIDLARLADPARPAAALLPGTIPQAHRGIIFVDEINRLADTSPDLADVLLDAMGTKPGRVQIEETGLPTVELPLAASVWAASNPDEDPGPLEDVRKQLSDRFDLVVAMGRPDTAEVVRTIMTQGLASLAAACGVGTAEPAGPGSGAGGCPGSGPADPPSRYRERLRALARPAALPRLPPELRDLVAVLYVEFSLESLRGVEALCQAATLFALTAGRDEVGRADVKRAAALTLGHRVDVATLAQILDRLEPGGASSRSGRRDAGNAGAADGGPDAARAASAAVPAVGGSGSPAADRHGFPGGDASRSFDGRPGPTPSGTPGGFWSRLVHRFRAAAAEHPPGGLAPHGWPGAPGWSGMPESLVSAYLASSGGLSSPAAGGARGRGRIQGAGGRPPDPATLPVCAPAERARHLWEIADDEVLGAGEPDPQAGPPRPWAP